MKPSYFMIGLFAVIAACNHKPKVISKDIHRTAVVVNGKKDSVTNNPQKNYGNATISNICTKTLLSNIQATDNYKHITSGSSPIKYVVNWIKAENPETRTNGSKITNGLQVLVNNNDKKLGAYIYNNEDGKLYFINNKNQYDQLDVDSNALKQIRNGCYWGVASHK